MQQRLSRRHERYLYLTGTLLAVSGVAWLIDHYLLRTPGMPTLGPHPSEAWWMRLHGAAVIGFLVAFGALLPGHIVQNWRQRANRYSGLTMVIVVSLLALSGYGLYYLVDDQQRTRDQRAALGDRPGGLRSTAAARGVGQALGRAGPRTADGGPAPPTQARCTACVPWRSAGRRESRRADLAGSRRGREHAGLRAAGGERLLRALRGREQHHLGQGVGAHAVGGAHAHAVVPEVGQRTAWVEQRRDLARSQAAPRIVGG